jgi:RNA polymerase sigma-70 factor (ECF subfamily)
MNPPSNEWSRVPEDAGEELVNEVRRAPEGDLRAFEELIRRYREQVVANCRYITREPNNAEDLAQEVLVKAFFTLHSFDAISSFETWLQAIKIKHCLIHVEKQAGWSYVGIEELDVGHLGQLHAQMTAEKGRKVSEKQIISMVLDSMSSTLRIPLVLCDMDELSYEEVARFLGISLSATKMRIKRGREEFRERYEKVLDAGVMVQHVE